MISYETNKFGTVTFEGKTFDLQSNADFTNTVLPSYIYKNYNDVFDGETYDVEFSASAADSEGNEATVYWMFEFVKGSEPEDLSDLNWNKIDRVEV